MIKSVSNLTLFLCISIGLVFLGCASKATQREKPIATYPSWFWQPPNLPFPTAVGYASIDLFHLDKAQEDAIDDGIERLAKSIRVRIHGEQSIINEQLTQNFQEETDDRIKEHVQDTHKLLATYHGSGLTIVLLGLGEATNGLVGATNLFAPVTPASPSTPDARLVLVPGWYENPPSQPGYIYSSGVSDGLSDMEYSSAPSVDDSRAPSSSRACIIYKIPRFSSGKIN